MNRYLHFTSTSFGYQTIARNEYNQTFVWYKEFKNVPVYTWDSDGNSHVIQGKFRQEFKSDLNYQLVVL